MPAPRFSTQREWQGQARSWDAYGAWQKKPYFISSFRRRGEGVEPSGERNARQAGFEDRWGHRAPSSSACAGYFAPCHFAM